MEKEFFYLAHQKKVLELGPFQGWYTQLLLNQNPKSITGIETSPGSVKDLKTKFHSEPRVEIQHADMFDYLNADSPNFDLVVACGVIYHTPAPILLLEKIVNFANPEDIIIDAPGSKLIKRKNEWNGYLESKFGSPGYRQALGYRQSGWVSIIPTGAITEILEGYGYILQKRSFVGDFNVFSKEHSVVLHYHLKIPSKLKIIWEKIRG